MRLGKRIQIAPVWDTSTASAVGAAFWPKEYPCASCEQKSLEGKVLAQMGKAVDSKLSRMGMHI